MKARAFERCEAAYPSYMDERQEDTPIPTYVKEEDEGPNLLNCDVIEGQLYLFCARLTSPYVMRRILREDENLLREENGTIYTPLHIFQSITDAREPKAFVRYNGATSYVDFLEKKSTTERI